MGGQATAIDFCTLGMFILGTPSPRPPQASVPGLKTSQMKSNSPHPSRPSKTLWVAAARTLRWAPASSPPPQRQAGSAGSSTVDPTSPRDFETKLAIGILECSCEKRRIG